MTERQDELLAKEDPRFFAIDKTDTGLGMLATTEVLPDGAKVTFGLPSGPALFLNIALAAQRRRTRLASQASSMRTRRGFGQISTTPYSIFLKPQ